MSTLTYEEVKSRIHARAEAIKAKERGDDRKPLSWNRDTVNTLSSDCNRYRIYRVIDSDEGTVDYYLETAATPTQAPKRIAGPFKLPRDARHAAQLHANNEPIQGSL